MKKIEITCDGCGHDLTTRSNSVDYRLLLTSESKPGYGAGAYTDMMVWPAIDRDHHFCGLGCLDHWRARENHEAASMKIWWETWKQEKGTAHSMGRSYPTPPADVLDPAKSKAKLDALTAFPLARPRRS